MVAGVISEECIMSSHRERGLGIEEDNSKENFSFVHTKKKKKREDNLEKAMLKEE